MQMQNESKLLWDRVAIFGLSIALLLLLAGLVAFLAQWASTNFGSTAGMAVIIISATVAVVLVIGVGLATFFLSLIRSVFGGLADISHEVAPTAKGQVGAMKGIISLQNTLAKQPRQIEAQPLGMVGDVPSYGAAWGDPNDPRLDAEQDVQLNGGFQVYK